MRDQSNARGADRQAIPQFRCPHCGAQMRLAKVEPDLDYRANEVLTYDCRCAFTFRHSVARAIARRGEAAA